MNGRRSHVDGNTLDDADPGEFNHWAALFLDRIKAIPGVTDVATDQLNAGPMLDVTIKREVASSYGILGETGDEHRFADHQGVIAAESARDRAGRDRSDRRVQCRARRRTATPAQSCGWRMP